MCFVVYNGRGTGGTEQLLPDLVPVCFLGIGFCAVHGLESTRSTQRNPIRTIADYRAIVLM